MIDPDELSKLPTHIGSVIAGIPSALIPNSIKAIDRLIGSAIDIPAAWLAQKKAQIDAQTESFKSVEKAIAEVAASSAAGKSEFVENAVLSLVRQSYRKQGNRQRVAAAAIETLAASPVPPIVDSVNHDVKAELEDDWLNVFERFAEDASSERMQHLWGRVLAGEVRTPGKYSLRTLRFLSEFSQSDGERFVEFSLSAFGGVAPKSLLRPNITDDIRGLIALESCGLIQGSDGFGLNFSINFDDNGIGVVEEDQFCIVFKGEAGKKISTTVLALTPLGQEIISLIPERDKRAVAIKFAESIRSEMTTSASIGLRDENSRGIIFLEKIW